MKPKFKELYKDIALRVAEMSHARRRKVGAVIVKDDRVISMGYNGMPAGWDNNCEDKIREPINDEFYSVDEYGPYNLKTKPEVLHAESNAIAKLARSDEHGLGADLFVTTAPCLDCAKLIYQSGISRVWYGSDYRDDSGIRFLKASGVEVTKHDE